MFIKIFRGAVIGVLLGVILGIGIPSYMKISNMVKSLEYNPYSDPPEMITYSDQEGDLACMSNYQEKELNDILIRFHVRDNSNSKKDIDLKYKVRDGILEYLKTRINGNMSRQEVIDLLNNSMFIINSKAKDIVKKEGYGYVVKAYLTEDDFPIRQYGDMLLPAGRYEALRIDIGMAKGENFWCLLYPTMCITKDAVAIVDEDSKEEIKHELTDEQYENLFNKQTKKKVKIKFKLLELFE